MFIDFFRVRKGGERVRETLIGYLPYGPPTGDTAYNLGMCPGSDQELNLKPFLCAGVTLSNLG